MPEAPEVATSRDKLRQLITNSQIVKLSTTSSGRYSKINPIGFDLVSNNNELTISEIGTRGKFMWWKLVSPDNPKPKYLHCTYGMSGGWFAFPTKHTAFVVEYEVNGEKSKLFFNDPRHFGTIKFIDGQEEHDKKLNTLGPCILGGLLTPEIFAENILRKHDRTIAEALMDQSSIAGCGNYIKAETLFRVKISPWRLVTEISSKEFISLCGHLIDVAAESYATQGATISTYLTVDGSKGSTQFSFKIYSKRMCPIGHSVLRDETPEGRTSWWCPQCQR